MTSDSRSGILPALFMALAASGWPVDAVRAQDDDSAQPGAALEEVIVTARRREESLMDTPVAITAFTTAELEARQISNTSDIDQAVPNLIYRTNAIQNTNASVIFIRGIGQRDFIPTVQPGVGIYVDDGYVAASIGSATELLDIESIEVLRGPQGTLFGRNTIGGAILINTVRPHEEFEGEVEAQFGELSRQHVRATVNVPFTDNFFGKFSAMHKSIDGHVDTPNIPDDDGAGSLEVTAARMALRWLNDSVTADFTADYSRRETDNVPTVALDWTPTGQVAQWNNDVAPVVGLPQWGPEIVPPFGTAVSQVTERYPGKADMYSSNFTLEWDISDSLTFKTITTYRNLEDFGGSDSDYSPLPIVRHVDITESEQITQEIQFSGVAADGRLDWVAGYFYFAEETLNLDAVHFPRFGIMSGSFVDNQSTALFGQFTYDISDRWSVTVGARSTKERLDNIVDDRFQFIPELFSPDCVTDECVNMFPSTFRVESGLESGFEEVSRTRIPGYRPFPQPPHPGAFLLAGNGLTETDKDATEPYLNLAYRFTDGLLGYISHAEGFKGGGFTQRLPPGRPVASFGPESAEVLEVGFKWQDADGRARVTGAAFHTDYTDLQVSITTLLGGGFSNAASAVIDGFELETLVQVTDRFQLSGGVGFLSGEYEELDPAVDTFTIDSVLPNVPEYQANLSGIYRFALPSGELTARLDYSYNGEIFSTAQNIILTPSFDLLNGSIVYTPSAGNWNLALLGRNLADEYYSEFYFRCCERAIGAMYLAPPRELMGKFTYRF